ncbi:fungal-specific transcription factor domain-containing protein [Corynespora cassiicola Philippines]|uniref:Fungal-specific transcription factor domain-containing protein n=1 Tax=Corynespora cassiicola Philippines TaxID=1448308 RepID=A0A2T2PB28_CORCC|nr:fungal-specific transcription factor domain-containing protein [Corynespora cassiicola Philippines]
MRTTTDKGPFYGRVFVRLPAQPLLEDLLQPAIEKLQLHGPLLSRDEFLKLVSDQYAAGADCMANPSRWVIINCFMPLALHHRVARGALPGLSTTAWSFFKNAFSIYPELLIHGNDPSACEALLAMAMFLLGTAEARTTSQVTAAVARMVHSLGLHQLRYYRNLEDSEAERCRNIFWMAYIMNEDMTQKYGLPSPFGNEAPALQLPSEKISGEMIPGYLRKLAELAVLQSRVSRVSITQKTLKEVGDSILDQGTVTFGDLKSWKKELPWNMQESAGGSEKELSMPVALLHFRYHSCVTKLHMRVAHILVTNDTSSTADGSGMSDHTQLTYKLAKGLAASAARNTISVVRQLSLEPYCQVWYMMCYPVSAVFLLLSTILEDPSASQAKSDAETIGQFVGYLERLVAAKSDVWKLLDGCSRIHKIAECAVDLHQRGRIPFSPEEASSEDETREKLEAIRAKLSPVTDWLYLAQGLLSNLDALRIDAEDTLSDICGMESPDGLYGAFTPEFIKSYSTNFLFAH